MKLPSLLPELTHALGGGLSYGTVVEFGAPIGQEGRPIILTFLATASQQGEFVLWINGHSDLRIFPPAWLSRGIVPEQFLVVDCDHPIRRLKRAILHPLIKVIVLDLGKVRLHQGEYAFLAHQARLHGQVIMVINNRWLSHRQGTLWAKLRANLQKDHTSDAYRITFLKGPYPHQLQIQEDSLERACPIPTLCRDFY